MCICLNCKYINVCKQYFFIEKNHKEENININAIFNPTYSIININFYTKSNKLFIEWDMLECLSFKEKPANWISYY